MADIQAKKRLKTMHNGAVDVLEPKSIDAQPPTLPTEMQQQTAAVTANLPNQLPVESTPAKDTSEGWKIQIPDNISVHTNKCNFNDKIKSKFFDVNAQFHSTKSTLLAPI